MVRSVLLCIAMIALTSAVVCDFNTNPMDINGSNMIKLPVSTKNTDGASKIRSSEELKTAFIDYLFKKYAHEDKEYVNPKEFEVFMKAVREDLAEGFYDQQTDNYVFSSHDLDSDNRISKSEFKNLLHNILIKL